MLRSTLLTITILGACTSAARAQTAFEPVTGNTVTIIYIKPPPPPAPRVEVAPCPEGKQRVGPDCVRSATWQPPRTEVKQPLQCPRGQIETNGQCAEAETANSECPEGYANRNGECVQIRKATQAPARQTLKCDPGFVDRGGRCEPLCRAGTTWKGGTCVANYQPPPQPPQRGSPQAPQRGSPQPPERGSPNVTINEPRRPRTPTDGGVDCAAFGGCGGRSARSETPPPSLQCPQGQVASYGKCIEVYEPPQETGREERPERPPPESPPDDDE